MGYQNSVCERDRVRRPDIILIDQNGQKAIIINNAVPADIRVGEKEREIELQRNTVFLSHNKKHKLQISKSKMSKWV